MTRYDPTSPGPVPSPCIGICRMEEGTGLCSGCLRTIDEIACWGGASEAVKREVWREIRRREAAQSSGATRR
ncbi:DUF1289 domain-containing protein [Noviherbaspirillum pedocola]|uniref:DUF1289 domain-containing protein n=1 Tax=Noviherbaspirillum pedocola TaxID=2801341 RepID=A0A934SZS2_9BURK|nr:DUF1289 domain-containing protein [Noviherbaspirillum pedocola]MBK4738305.1 DUF1289 domain-containing protein [Noviherbaspirillum pedocola]